MANFFERLSAGTVRALCEDLTTNPGWLGDFRRVLLPGAAVNLYERLGCTLCGACGEPSAPPPFTGGQCSYNYVIVSLADRCPADINDRVGIIAGIPGPISLTGQTTVERPFFPVNRLTTWSFTGGDGNLRTMEVAHRQQDTPCFRIFPSNPADVDDCGNPLPNPDGRGPINVNINVDFDAGDETNITIPVGIIFGVAYVAINGQLTVPVNFNGPFFEWSGNITFDPEFNIEINPPDGGRPGLPDDDDLPPGDPPNDGDDPPLGPDPTILAVAVRSQPTGRDRQTLIPDSKGPNILAPGIGTIRFAIRTGSIVSWTRDIRIKGVNEFIECPWFLGAEDYSVRWEAGWDGEATAIRGRPLGAS